jgi:hypothetical protein
MRRRPETRAPLLWMQLRLGPLHGRWYRPAYCGRLASHPNSPHERTFLQCPSQRGAVGRALDTQRLVLVHHL